MLGAARLELRGCDVTFSRLFVQVLNGPGAPAAALVSLDDSRFSGPTSLVEVSPGVSTRVDARLARSTVQDAGVGATAALRLLGNGLATADISSSTVEGMGGLVGTASLRATVSDSAFSGGVTGISLDALTGSPTLVLRRTRVTQNQLDGVVVSGGPLASFDLGTSADAGLNVLQGNLRTNLRAAGDVLALGNWWDPNVQGSSDAGTYAALPDGGAFVVTPAMGGPNVSVSSGSVRLAE